MVRDNDKRLEELKTQGIEPYSISRLDCINNCLYEAYLTYRQGKRGKPNIYSALGGRIHDVLEQIVNGEATEDDLLPAMNLELEDMDILDISFPKDRNGGDSIRNGWIADMTHFCKTYKSPKRDFSTEKLFVYETPSHHYLIGYIDLEENVSDGVINIFDYKTSSLYKGEDIKKHGRQLITYLLGEEQAGLHVEKVAWNFLKYCEVHFTGKKTARSKEETELIKVIERKQLGAELAPYVEKKLADAGYDEVDAESYMLAFQKSGLLSDLPTEVASQFKIEPYICYYDFTDEIKQECIDYIENTIAKWESLADKDVSAYPPRPFTKIQKNGKEVGDYFYCTQLCGHFKECPHIQDYLKTLDTTTDEEDMFA